MAANCLKMNGNKTEIMVVGNPRILSGPQWWPAELGQILAPTFILKNLGIWLDCHLKFDHQINKVRASCFGFLRCLRTFFWSLLYKTQKTLIQAIISRLDYRNVLNLGVN